VDMGTIGTKRAMLEEAKKETERASFLASLTTAAALAHAKKGINGLDDASNQALQQGLKALSGDEEAQRKVSEQLQKWLATDLPPGAFERKPIHWPLAFPEVFEKGGFDAIIGNPPFLGSQKLTGLLGMAYREAL